LIPRLEKLDELLHDNNTEAAEYTEELVKHTKNTAFAAQAEELKYYVDRYDFERAIDSFDQLFKSFWEDVKDGRT